MLPRRRTATVDHDEIQEYQHEPLKGAQWIRLLNIIPSPHGTDTVTCTITQMSTAGDQRHSHKYEAMSWCWGEIDLPPERAIHILASEGSSRIYKKEISEHLYDALKALRRQKESRRLWVDALCIDMEKHAERSQQVSRMSEIYGDAENVCVWLGQGNPDSDMAMDFIKNQILHVLEFDELCETPKYLDHWTALLDLMKKDWFQRKWIVQEVSLARRATIHCGEKYVDWKSFAAAVSLFTQAEHAASSLNDLVRKEAGFKHADAFFDELPYLAATRLVNITESLCKKSARGSIQRTATLEDIVAQLATFQTGEPRDNIYALLALAKDSQPAVAGIPNHLGGEPLTDKQKRVLAKIARLLPNPYRTRYIVDYKQRVVDVYQQFIAFAISRSDPQCALDIICRPFAAPYTRAQDAKFNKEALESLKDDVRDEVVPLPSWIASVESAAWGKEQVFRTKRKSDFAMERQRGDPFVSSPRSSGYNAAMGKHYNKTKVRFRKRQAHYSMYVEGFVLDRIKEVDTVASAGVIPAQWLERGQKHQKQDEDAFWKTLVADRSPYGNALPFYQIALRECLKESIRAKRTFAISSRIREAKSKVVNSTLQQVQATIWERRLFETERGHLGLGPADTAVGDCVCIIYGCSVPVVLRRVAKTQEQMSLEADEDEADRLERQEKVIELVKKVFKRKAAHHARRGASGRFLLALRKFLLTSVVRNESIHALFAKRNAALVSEALSLILPIVDFEGILLLVAILAPLLMLRGFLSRNPETRKGADEQPHSEYFTVIGESYVHEMMNGAAITWQNEQNDLWTKSQKPHDEDERDGQHTTEGAREAVRPRIFELR